MKSCHVCLNLCEDEAEICPICGAELLAEPDKAEKTAEEKVIKNPVLAASADSPVTAEIFKDVLAENGIAFSVDEKGDFMHVGFGGSYFAVDIYVDESDLEAAKELYRNLTENGLDFDGFDDFDGDDGENV